MVGESKWSRVSSPQAAVTAAGEKPGSVPARSAPPPPAAASASALASRSRLGLRLPGWEGPVIPAPPSSEGSPSRPPAALVPSSPALLFPHSSSFPRAFAASLTPHRTPPLFSPSLSSVFTCISLHSHRSTSPPSPRLYPPAACYPPLHPPPSPQVPSPHFPLSLSPSLFPQAPLFHSSFHPQSLPLSHPPPWSRDEPDLGLRPPARFPLDPSPGTGAAVPGPQRPTWERRLLAPRGSGAPLARPGANSLQQERSLFVSKGLALPGPRPPGSSSRAGVLASRAGSSRGPEPSSITRETGRALGCAGGVALPSTAVCGLPVRRTQPGLDFGPCKPLLQGGNGRSWVWMKGST